ncbi:MAG: Flp pilus assembly protein CpaB [Burkholderiaceae bacterium]
MSRPTIHGGPPPGAQTGRRWITAVLWVGAVVFGLIGVYGTRGYIANRLDAERARLADQQRMVAAVVAGKDLPAGTVVSTESMAVREVPARFFSASMIAADDFDAFAGQRLQLAMAGGEPLLRTALGSPQGAFSDRVAPGIRAMTIQVDEVNSVSGMLRPGDRIDLLFSTNLPMPGRPRSGEIAAPLMQDLLVLATGSQTAGPNDAASADRFTTITVEVTPVQAQKLVLAQRGGRLTALLRNSQDRRAMDQRAMDLFALLGIEPAVPAIKRSGPEMIIGGQGRLAVQVPVVAEQP